MAKALSRLSSSRLWSSLSTIKLSPHYQALYSLPSSGLSNPALFHYQAINLFPFPFYYFFSRACFFIFSLYFCLLFTFLLVLFSSLFLLILLFHFFLFEIHKAQEGKHGIPHRIFLLKHYPVPIYCCMLQCPR